MFAAAGQVVICGDTADASALGPLARDCDVLVHEATNAYLPHLDGAGTSWSEVQKQSRRHGHSTPEVAGTFAAKVGARRLVLNHFSPRYRGDDHPQSVYTMLKIEDAARRKANLPVANVHAAWDLMSLPVPMRDEELGGGK